MSKTFKSLRGRVIRAGGGILKLLVFIVMWRCVMIRWDIKAFFVHFEWGRRVTRLGCGAVAHRVGFLEAGKRRRRGRRVKNDVGKRIKIFCLQKTRIVWKRCTQQIGKTARTKRCLRTKENSHYYLSCGPGERCRRGVID